MDASISTRKTAPSAFLCQCLSSWCAADNPDAPQLLFREDACLQCGICAATCPENVISLVPQFNLSDTAMAAEMVTEDTPFHCEVAARFWFHPLN